MKESKLEQIQCLYNEFTQLKQIIHSAKKSHSHSEQKIYFSNKKQIQNQCTKQLHHFSLNEQTTKFKQFFKNLPNKTSNSSLIVKNGFLQTQKNQIDLYKICNIIIKQCQQNINKFIKNISKRLINLENRLSFCVQLCQQIHKIKIKQSNQKVYNKNNIINIKAIQKAYRIQIDSLRRYYQTISSNTQIQIKQEQLLNIREQHNSLKQKYDYNRKLTKTQQELIEQLTQQVNYKRKQIIQLKNQIKQKNYTISLLNNGEKNGKANQENQQNNNEKIKKTKNQFKKEQTNNASIKQSTINKKVQQRQQVITINKKARQSQQVLKNIKQNPLELQDFASLQDIQQDLSLGDFGSVVEQGQQEWNLSNIHLNIKDDQPNQEFSSALKQLTNDR